MNPTFVLECQQITKFQTRNDSNGDGFLELWRRPEPRIPPAPFERRGNRRGLGLLDFRPLGLPEICDL